MVATTLMPLTTGFLVILKGVHLAKHSPTSSEHKIGDTLANDANRRYVFDEGGHEDQEDGDTFEFALG